MDYWAKKIPLNRELTEETLKSSPFHFRNAEQNNYSVLLAQLRDSAADESYKAGVYIDVTV